MSGNTVWIPVLASMKGFISEVNKGADTASKTAGQTLEKGLGAAGAAGGKSAASELASAVEAQTKKVVAARTREAGAASALQVEEAKLEQLRKSGSASAGEIATAEARVENARSQQVAMQQRLAAAESDLASVRNGGEARASSLVAAENKLTDAKLATERAARQITAAEQRAEDARAASLAATNRAEHAEVQLSLARREFGEDSQQAQRAERELEQARKKADSAATAAVRAEGEVKKERRAGESTTDQLRAAELRHAAALEDVEKASHEAADATDEVGSSMDGLMGAVKGAGGIFAGLGVAMGVDAMMGSADAIANMNRQLGLTGPAAESAAADVSSVMRSGLVSGTDEAAAAVGALNSQFKYLGSEGEKTAGELSRNLLGFTQTFGMEAAEATQTVGQLVKNGLASDVTEGLDLMTAAFQRVPAEMRGELPEIINEYGTNFRALGFTGQEAFGMLVTQAENGKWALDKTGDALKEFTIRGSDMSKSSVGAFESLGLSAGEMASKIAGGGAGAREALQLTADKLLAIEDPAERANTAIALFGTPLEDLSVDQIPTFLEGLTGAGSTMDGFAGSSEQLAQSIESSLTGRLNVLKGTLVDLATGAFMQAWDAAAGFIDFIERWKGPLTVAGLAVGSLAAGMLAYNIQAGIASAGGVVGAFTKLGGALKQSAMGQLLLNGAMWANPITWVVAGIVALVGGLYLFFTKTETGRKAWETFTNFIKSAWDKTTAAFSSGIDSLRSWWDGLVNSFSTGVDSVRSWWDGLVNGFSDGVTKVTDFFSNIRSAWGELKDAFNGGDSGYGALAALIGEDKAEWAVNAFASVKDAWEELKTAFQGGDWGYGALSQIVGEDHAQTIVNAVGQVGAALTGMKDFALAAVAPVRDLFTNVFAQWQATITAGWQIIQTIFGLGWEIVKQVAAAAWLILVSIFTGNFSQIGTIVSNAWTNIQMFFSTAFTNILAIAQGWVDGTLARISFLWQQAQFYFQAGVAFVQGVWGMMVDWVVTKATEWATSVVDRVVQLYTSVTAWIDQLPGRVEGAFLALVSAALNQVQAWYTNTTTTVTDLVNDVINYVNELPGKIGEIFGNAGEWLVNAGKNILSGLWNGMKSIWGDVEGWLNGLQEKVTRVFSRVTNSASSANSAAHSRNANGSFTAYVDGGIQQLEAFANGGGTLPANPVIERPHGTTGLVQWAEASTGGELFAPVDQLRARTPRAMAIMAAGAAMAGAALVDKKTGEQLGGGYGGDLGPQTTTAFADGGVTAEDLRRFVEGDSVGGHQARRSLEGAPYDWAGVNWGDCSGTQSAIARFATGQDPFGGRFATGNEAEALSSMGFERGRGGDGDLRIGFLNGGPAGGHTAGTLPDGTNVEMGGGRGNGQIGGAAAGAWDSYFDTFFYLPIVPPIQIDTSPTGMDPVQINARRASGITGAYGTSTTMAPAATTGAQTVDPRLAAPASQQEATAYGVDVAKSVFAKGMGSKSALQLGADAAFDFLGMGDSLTKKLVTTPPDQLAPVPEWYGNTATNTGVTTSGADNARTSLAEEHAATLHDAAVTTMTPAQIKTDPQLKSLNTLDVVEMPKGPGADWGEKFFAYEIARAALDRSLSAAGAKIGEAVALVESGDPMQMWANNAVPASLGFRHDAVGSDYDSVGLFQQRDNGAWGTVDQRMDPYQSAGLFFDAMLQRFPNWQAMDPGAVAQGVQGSAYPDRYATKMDHAEQLVTDTGLYDTGGFLPHRGLALNLSGKREPVLTHNQWDDVTALISAVDTLVSTAATGDWGLGTLAHILGDDAAPGGPDTPDLGAATHALDNAATSILGPSGLGTETPGMQLVVNLDGQKVFEERIEAVEGKAEVNEKELRDIKRERRAPGTGVTLLA